MTRRTCTLHEDVCTLMIIYCLILRRMKNAQSCGKIKTYFILIFFFFRKSCRIWGNVEKCGRARQATDDNIWHMRSACCI